MSKAAHSYPSTDDTARRNRRWAIGVQPFACRIEASFDIRPLLHDRMGPTITVILQDIFRLRDGRSAFNASLPLGQQYQIPLQRGFGESLSLVCTVVRCDQLDEGLFSVGFEFNSFAAAVDAGQFGKSRASRHALSDIPFRTFSLANRTTQ